MTDVLIAGGGPAALELLLALGVLAGGRAAITVLTPQDELVYRPMTVAEPFGRGGPRTHSWSAIAAQQGARLVFDALEGVDPGARVASTRRGLKLPYDVLVVATGARRIEPLPGAVTFGAGPAGGTSLGELVRELVELQVASVAFALPTAASWPLPLYELALLTAHELREHGARTAVRIVTPEESPLELFGDAAAGALAPFIETLGVEIVTERRPRWVKDAGVVADGGDIVAAERVVTLAEVASRPVLGLPVDSLGFLPVDAHGRVRGVDGVFAAGEVTSFPLRQGGLAAQQADAVAEAIAAACGASLVPTPFDPLLRGLVLTSGAPVYLHARPFGPGEASARPLWTPPDKIAGRYLTPYLGTARPARLGAQPLVDRVASAPPEDDAAARVALRIAERHARWQDTALERQARDAARALGAAAYPVPATAG